jgi:hypothetical protein
MQINDRRAGRERRSGEGFNQTAPFLTKDGLVFSDRRRTAERREFTVSELMELGDVEEIELEPVRSA